MARGTPAGVATRLGLPSPVRACLFDLDGVLTRTAKVHAAAWKAMFDEYLRGRAERRHEAFVAFDATADYRAFVDGRPRLEGVRTFLAARRVTLAEGGPDDPPGTETIAGLGNRKNELVLRMIRDDGVEVYAGSVRYVRAAGSAGLARCVVSSSANCRLVLEAAGIEDLFEHVVDGRLATREHLRGKPEPDTFLAGARLAGVSPGEAAVFEDALAGVEAGRAGRFGFVVGVDHLGQRAALLERGADRVVGDLAELLEAP